MLAYINDALNGVRNMGVKVPCLLFDAGFTSVALSLYLQERDYTYAIRFSSNGAVKLRSPKISR